MTDQRTFTTPCNICQRTVRFHDARQPPPESERVCQTCWPWEPEIVMGVSLPVTLNRVRNVNPRPFVTRDGFVRGVPSRERM